MQIPSGALNDMDIRALVPWSGEGKFKSEISECSSILLLLLIISLFFLINFMYEILTHNISPKLLNEKGVGQSLLYYHAIISFNICGPGM